MLYVPKITGNAGSIARFFSSMAALLLFTGGGHVASSRLAMNENRRTLNTTFPGILGIEKPVVPYIISRLVSLVYV
jgi:hypothetical protein